MAAAIVVIVVIVVVMLMLVVVVATIVIVVVVMVMLVLVFVAAAIVVIVVIVVMMLVFIFLGKFFQLGIKTVFLFHRGKNRLSVQLVPLRGNVIRVRVHRLQRFDTCMQLFLGHSRRMRKHHAGSVFHLIDEKFAEVFHIHFALIRVHNGAESVQNAVFHVRPFHRANHVAQFSHARRFDNNPIGSILLFHLLQRFREIAHQRAAYAPRIHFGNVHAGIL